MRLQRAAGVARPLWHGDVFRTVCVLVEHHPELCVRTIVGSGNPQALIWNTRPDVPPALTAEQLCSYGNVSYETLFADGVPAKFARREGGSARRGLRRLSGDSPGEPTAHHVRLIAFYTPVPPRGGQRRASWSRVHRVGPRRRRPAALPGAPATVIPGELGFYDLRVPEVREAQAGLARQYGISAFCWWHYWSLGRRLLERPFRRVLESGEPGFPFCLAWANHGWAMDPPNLGIDRRGAGVRGRRRSRPSLRCTRAGLP